MGLYARECGEHAGTVGQTKTGIYKQPPEYIKLAPGKIVYADLMGTRDSRNIETAERVKKYDMEDILPIPVIELRSDAQKVFVEEDIGIL